MDALDFKPIAADLQARWFAFPIPETALAQFVIDLADLDAADVAAAVTAIATEGSDRPPTAGRIRQRVAELQLGAPAWFEVKRSLVEREIALRDYVAPEWTCPYGSCDGSGFVMSREPRKVALVHNGRIERIEAHDDIDSPCRCRAERKLARRMAETLHPLVREFVAGNYVTWDEVATVGQGGATTLEAQMRSKWEAFISRAVESRSLAVIEASPSMARIAAARDEDARREPRRPDYAGLLERGAA